MLNDDDDGNAGPYGPNSSLLEENFIFSQKKYPSSHNSFLLFHKKQAIVSHSNDLFIAEFLQFESDINYAGVS